MGDRQFWAKPPQGGRTGASVADASDATFGTAVTAAGQTVLAVVTSLTVVFWSHPPYRAPAAGPCIRAQVALSAMPILTVEFVSSPSVDVSTGVEDDCAAPTHPIIALVVGSQMVRVVGLSRIGGLYGP